MTCGDCGRRNDVVVIMIISGTVMVKKITTVNLRPNSVTLPSS